MKKGFIFDLDGTVYLDEEIIPGAVETIEYLEQEGNRVVFLTNKSIETTQSYVEKLEKLGINTNEKNVINSNLLVARYLKQKLKENEKVMVIGEKPLYDEIQLHGIQITNKPEDIKIVVLGWDRNFTYEKLNIAFQAWLLGATIIATNPDRTCPIENNGQVPDCGAMIGALEGATGQKVNNILGKPSLLAAEYIVENILELSPANCYMVGDRLETDIKMGNEYGMNSILVLSGISNSEMVSHSKYKPDYIIESIKDLVNLKF